MSNERLEAASCRQVSERTQVEWVENEPICAVDAEVEDYEGKEEKDQRGLRSNGGYKIEGEYRLRHRCQSYIRRRELNHDSMKVDAKCAPNHWIRLDSSTNF